MPTEKPLNPAYSHLTHVIKSSYYRTEQRMKYPPGKITQPETILNVSP